jgi:hypothetical protein
MVPDKDHVLRLKQPGSVFVQVMTGHTPSELQKLNPRNLIFYTASDSDLTPDGTHIVDAYGNQDIVIIMDTNRDGHIDPFTVTMTGGDGRTVTIRQTKPVYTNIIVMSPGRGLTDGDAVTTWDVR